MIHTAARPAARSAVLTDWVLVGCPDPDQPLCEIVVEAQPFTIGRSSGCDLTINSRRVSGEHAELMQVGDHLLLRDSGSTNGTFLAGRRVTEVTPVGDGDLLAFADSEFRLRWVGDRGETPILSSAHEQTAVELDTFEPNWLFSNFEKLLGRPGVIPHYQPVVDFATGESVGHEALARSNTPGMTNPAAMFATAELLGREVEFSKECRHRGVFVSQYLPGGLPVYLNTHPAEELLTDVLPDIAKLRERYEGVPLVVEIHEGAFEGPDEMRKFARCLEDLAVEFAYDDFGAGRSRLAELLEVPPSILKYDAGLIRMLESPDDRVGRMLGSMVQMLRDAGIRTLAEGVETEQQAEICRELGFDLAQGYLFGRPAAPENFVALDDTVEVPLSK